MELDDVEEVRKDRDVSIWNDLKHELELNLALMPGFLAAIFWLLILLIMRHFLRDTGQVELYTALLYWIGNTAFAISFMILIRDSMSSAQKVLLLLQPLFVSVLFVFGVGGYLLKEGIVSEMTFLLGGPAVGCGISTWSSALLVNKMETLRSQLSVSIYIVPPAILGTLLSYSYFAFVLVSKLDPMIEVLIGGVAYPLAVALVGKVLLCDFSAYLVHFACKVDYVEAVDYMVGFMRIMFFMNLQASVFMLESYASFVLALFSNIAIELVFLPFNVKVATLDNFKRIMTQRQAKVAPKKPPTERSKSIVQNWFTFDRLPPGIRFGRHYYHEAIAEKVSLVGVVTVGFFLQMQTADEQRLLEIFGRCLTVIMFEFMEDLSKRRLLFYLLNVNMVDLEIDVNWKTNLKLSGFVGMTVYLLLLGETIAHLMMRS